MSVTLEDSSRSPWVEVGVVKNLTPPDNKEIEEVRQLFHELALKIASNNLYGKKTTVPRKKVAKKTLSLDAGRMF